MMDLRFAATAAVLVVLVDGCGGPGGIVVEGRVAYADGQPAAAGEVWLEPDEAALAAIRPARAAIADGRFRFPAASGLRAGRWVARVYSPPLGSLSGPAELAASFDDLHQPVVITPGDDHAQLRFTVTRRSRSAPGRD